MRLEILPLNQENVTKNRFCLHAIMEADFGFKTTEKFYLKTEEETVYLLKALDDEMLHQWSNHETVKHPELVEKLQYLIVEMAESNEFRYTGDFWIYWYDENGLVHEVEIIKD